MDAQSYHIVELFYRSQAGIATEQEQAELDAWAAAHPQQAARLAVMEEEGALRQLLEERSVSALAQLDRELYEMILGRLGWKETRPVVHRVHFLKTAWFKYAAAIIIIFGIGAYLWNMQNNSRTITQTQPVPIEKDILPGGQKAMLTLADGRRIVLDSAANGQLAVENGSEVIKKDGQVIYGAGQLNNNMEMMYNTMSTPKGGQYQLTLADGTKVWLNAASSITYPTVFNGKIREVSITGEAYFEVTKNAKMPFVVKTGKENITVLGTSFNVNRYSDEPKGKISLVDGSVKVNDKLLQPGQAYLDGKIINTNIEQDVAWKNGLFDFKGTDLKAVIRQLERWYDIKIDFKGKVDDMVMNGKMDREVRLSDVIRFFNSYGFETKLEGRTLVVIRK